MAGPPGRGRADVNHGVPEAWERAERTDTVGLCLAQDVAEVHRGGANHTVGHFIGPAEVLLLCLMEDTACHVHTDARQLSEVSLDRVEVGHDSDHEVADTIGHAMSDTAEDSHHN